MSSRPRTREWDISDETLEDESSSSKLSNRLLKFSSSSPPTSKKYGSVSLSESGYINEHLRKLNERIAYLQNENGKHNEVLQQHIRYYSGEINKLTEELEECRRSSHDMEEDVEEGKLDLDKIANEKHHLTLEINSLVDKLEKKDLRVRAFEKGEMGWKEKYEDLSSEFIEYKRNIKKDIHDWKRQSEDFYRKFQNELSEKNRVKQIKEDLQLDHETLKKQHKDVVEKVNELNELYHSKANEVNHVHQNFNGEKQNMEIRMNEVYRENELMKEDISSLENENNILKDQIKTLKDHSKHIEKNSGDSIRRLRNQFQSEKYKVTRLEQRLKIKSAGLSSPPKKYKFSPKKIKYQPPPIRHPSPKKLFALPTPKLIEEKKRITRPSTSYMRRDDLLRPKIRKSFDDLYPKKLTSKNKLGYLYPSDSQIQKKKEEPKSDELINREMLYKKRNFSQLQELQKMEYMKTKEKGEEKKVQSVDPLKYTHTGPIRSYKRKPSYDYDKLDYQKNIKNIIHGKQLPRRKRVGKKRYNKSQALYDHQKRFFEIDREDEVERIDKRQDREILSQQRMEEDSEEVPIKEEEREDSEYVKEQKSLYSNLLDQMKSGGGGRRENQRKKFEKPPERERRRVIPREEKTPLDEKLLNDPTKSKTVAREKWNKSQINELLVDQYKPAPKRVPKGNRKAGEVNPLEPKMILKKTGYDLKETSEKITVADRNDVKDNFENLLNESKHLESTLWNFGLEKTQLEGELQKLADKTKTSQTLRRKREINSRMGTINRRMSDIRNKLRKIGAFY